MFRFCTVFISSCCQSAAHEVCWLRSNGATGVALEPSRECSESTTRNLDRARVHTLSPQNTLKEHRDTVQNGFRKLKVSILGICLFLQISFRSLIFNELNCKKLIYNMIQKKTTTILMYCLRTNLCLSFLRMLSKSGKKTINKDKKRRKESVFLFNSQIIKIQISDWTKI